MQKPIGSIATLKLLHSLSMYKYQYNNTVIEHCTAGCKNLDVYAKSILKHILCCFCKGFLSYFELETLMNLIICKIVNTGANVLSSKTSFISLVMKSNLLHQGV